MRRRPAAFVLALHSHLPWVLHHGRWPHGSDWLCEAVLDSYLPLLAELRSLARRGVAAPITLGVTPVLANQLASPAFAAELERYFEQRLQTCAEAPASLRATGDERLLPLVRFWTGRLQALRKLYRSLAGGIIGALRELEQAGAIELVTSAATHGFLPLFARDESIRLQLALGRTEHRRLFGRVPEGLWLPECAYRPRGPWRPLPDAPPTGPRRGIEEHVADVGFRYFFVDAHQAGAGRVWSGYGEEPDEPSPPVAARHSPHRAYRVFGRPGGRTVSVLVRDPVASRQVWDRHLGYPGDEWYLEFHKIRWPGGLKFWRVSAPGSDLGAKAPYEPERASGRAAEHARHFASLLEELATAPTAPGGPAPAVLAVPFDTELFGHWWFEGVDFLGWLFVALQGRSTIRPRTASAALADHPARRGIRLQAGSWGAGGDFSMWLNEGTRWTWHRLWALETLFWDRAAAALSDPARRPILAQAARELLLAQASDWPFIITTGAAADYATRRLTRHCEDAEALLAALDPAGSGLEPARALADELWRRDHCFPEVLPAVEAALHGSREVAV
ncbi:MAG TPA: 1,4-alpha-glucan branching protein domain-containing protein [Gemmatimonadales bacterium]|nr:1,4-alpha-glucan branching protein domain-containing protein [Gemmatimonadales bacterium]